MGTHHYKALKAPDTSPLAPHRLQCTRCTHYFQSPIHATEYGKAYDGCDCNNCVRIRADQQHEAERAEKLAFNVADDMRYYRQERGE